MSVIKDLTPQRFDQRINNTPLEPFAVECYGDHCSACAVLERLLKQMIEAGEIALPVFKINVDEHPAFAKRLGIKGLPTLIAVKADATTQSTLAMPNRSMIEKFFRSACA